MEAVNSSENPLPIHKFTRYHEPEAHNRNFHRSGKDSANVSITSLPRVCVSVCVRPRMLPNLLGKAKGKIDLNPLTPNDSYSGRTAPLTSKRCILYIYSTNTGTEYFKHGIYSPFFFLFKMQFVS